MEVRFCVRLGGAEFGFWQGRRKSEVAPNAKICTMTAGIGLENRIFLLPGVQIRPRAGRQQVLFAIATASDFQGADVRFPERWKKIVVKPISHRQTSHPSAGKGVG
jgi:hypothetical protein